MTGAVRRRATVRWLGVVVGGVAFATAVLAVALPFWPSPLDDRFATVDHPVRSPSGTFQAEVYPGPYAYSTRHGVGVTWHSTADQLWVLSADVGTSRIDRVAAQHWAATWITPETRAGIPAEIAD